MSVLPSTVSPLVQFEKRGHIALITLNRPEAHNALSPEVVVRLAEAWSTVRDDVDIRVAVITGSGQQTFCAGADLARLVMLYTGARIAEDEWDRVLLQDFDLLQRALLRTFDCGKPVIVAANGNAIAGGMELMQASDIRVLAEHGKLGLQEVKWGIVPAGGSTVRLPRQMPYCVAMEIMLTGDLISAQRGLELGFVNYVLPAAEVLPMALNIAERIAGNGPLAVQAVRRSVRETMGLSEPDALKREMELAMPVMMSQDAREGPRAFKEKRKPCFIGA